MTQKLRGAMPPIALSIAVALTACSGSQTSSNTAASPSASATVAPAAAATPATLAPAQTGAPAPANAPATSAPLAEPTPDRVAVRAPSPASSCDLPGGWWFKGSCVVQLVTGDGARFALPAYRGIALSMAFGANDAPAPVPFVVGDALGDGDVAGRLNGLVPFTGYGKRCLTASRTVAPCVGKPLLYLTVANGGHVRVRFNATPAMTIVSAKGFPGKLCAVATLVGIDPSRQTVWVVPPIFAVPSRTTLHFASAPTPQTYADGRNFTAFAIVCR